MNTYATPSLIRILFLLLVAAGSALPARAATVLINPSNQSVMVGQTFSVNVSISGVADLYAFQFDLGYDPTLLSATNVSEGAFLPTGGSTLFLPGTIDNTAGSIAFTADGLQGPVAGVSGSGVLALAEFTALAPGWSGISLFNVILLDSNGLDIEPVTSGGNVQIAVIPLPAAFPLLSFGLAALGIGRRFSAWRK